MHFAVRHRLLAPLLLLVACADSTGSGVEQASASPALTGLRDCSAANTLRFDSLATFNAGLHHSPRSYTALSIDAMNSLIAAVRALDQADLERASKAAKAAGYQLLPLAAGSACDWLLAPPNFPDRIEQALLIYNPAWRRDLVIEAPHARDDHHTGAEAVLLLEQVGAKAAVISGAWRCVQGVASSGCHKSAECSPLDRSTGTHLRIAPADSDPSHSIHNAVYAAHVAFRTTDAIMLQLHTNFHPELNGDAMVSNGTRYVIPGTVADALYAALQAPDVSVGSCNSPDFPAQNAFCGETTTESLVSNGAADTCLGRPSSDPNPSAHRFIHLEQASGRMCLSKELAQSDAGVGAADAGAAAGGCIESFQTWSERIGAALEKAIPVTR